MDMIQYRQIMKGKEQLLAELNDEKKDLKWQDTAAIAIIFEDSIHVSPNQACHAGLSNRYAGNKERGAIGVVSALMKPYEGRILEEEEATFFLDWLLNRSPYASTFVTKSAHQALFEKVIISDTTKPSNLMAAGLVASRRLWEYPHYARLFVDLSKGGMNENLAFWLAHMANFTFDRSGSFTFKAGYCSHCSLSSSYTEAITAKNFIAGSVVKPNKPFIESYEYRGYDAMFGGKASPLKSLVSWIHDNFPYGGEAVKDVNPFQAAKKIDDKKCSYEHAVKTLIEFEPKIMEQINNA